MGSLEGHETFTAEIDRVSTDGNGIVYVDGYMVNIGPVYKDSVGEEIEATRLSRGFALCHTDSVKVPGYRPQFISLAKYSLSKDVLTELQTEDHDILQKEPEHNVGKSQENTSPSQEGEKQYLTEYRKKAEEDAVEEIPESASKQYETQEYNRSTAVREYVKLRSDGYCEGCGEPAPFKSKTGEPYLHAHHVHELGNGGSDTPDTVISLCPNCHYRVHHGEDGMEFNQELIQRLADIEDVPVESIR